MSDAGVALLTGEIGAGKTTLLKSLLGELDPRAVDSAIVVSTQLSADELIVAVSIALGIRTGALEPRGRLTALLRHLIGLDKSGRRVVLVIDEAQNLREDAFKALATLVNRRQPRALPLQLVLAGQPELQGIVRTDEFAPLRRAIATQCHLDGLDTQETTAYVMHRLRKVGWTGNPSFQKEACGEIFRWTEGIPRLINVLCNRLLLTQALESRTVIDAAAVQQTARALQAEFGGSEWEPEHAEVSESDPIGDSKPAQFESKTRIAPGAILCVAASIGDHVKAAALMSSLALTPAGAGVRLVSVYDDGALELCQDLLDGIVSDRLLASLEVLASLLDTSPPVLDSIAKRIIDEHCPCAVIVFDGSDAAFAFGKIAVASQVVFVQADAGIRCEDARTTTPSIRALTDSMAHLLFTADEQATQTLRKEGFAAQRISCVGSLLADAIELVLKSPTMRGGERVDAMLKDRLVAERSGYALLVAGSDKSKLGRPAMIELLTMVKSYSRDTLVLWPMQKSLLTQLRRQRLDDFFTGTRVMVVPARAYPEYVHLLGGANCVITDAAGVQDEATVLGVPCFTFAANEARRLTVSAGSNTVIGNSVTKGTQAIWRCIFTGGKRGESPPLWDGEAGTRMTQRLLKAAPTTTLPVE